MKINVLINALQRLDENEEITVMGCDVYGCDVDDSCNLALVSRKQDGSLILRGLDWPLDKLSEKPKESYEDLIILGGGV